jgi:hypothetical protein
VQVVGFCGHRNEQYYLLEFDVVCVVEFTYVSEERTAPIIRVEDLLCNVSTVKMGAVFCEPLSHYTPCLLL